jgi:hypothetical protein
MKTNFFKLTSVALVAISVASCASVGTKKVEKERTKNYSLMKINELTPNEKLIAYSQVDNAFGKSEQSARIKANILKTFSTQDKLYLFFMGQLRSDLHHQNAAFGTNAKILYDIKQSGLFKNVIDITCSKGDTTCTFREQSPKKRYFFISSMYLGNYGLIEAKNGNALACKMLYSGRNKYDYNDDNGLYFQAISSCEKLNIPGYSFYNAYNRLKLQKSEAKYSKYFNAVIWPKFLHEEVKSAINACRSVRLPSVINLSTVRNLVSSSDFYGHSNSIYSSPKSLDGYKKQIYNGSKIIEVDTEIQHITQDNLQISPHTTPIIAKLLCNHYKGMYIK